MSNPIDTLGEIVFSGIPSNAGYDLLKTVWQKATQRSWEELFLDSFQRAVERESVRLRKYAESDGEISLDLKALQEI